MEEFYSFMLTLLVTLSATEPEGHSFTDTCLDRKWQGGNLNRLAAFDCLTGYAGCL